uniref:Uncharacterized protein n=1 Tax=Panagrolaimus sp. ES5 TaxID=591445 RepID=A0AC34G669_9BILA
MYGEPFFDAIDDRMDEGHDELPVEFVPPSKSIDVEFYRRFATELEKQKSADPKQAWPTADKNWITVTEEEVQAMIERESANLKKAQDEGVKVMYSTEF